VGEYRERLHLVPAANRYARMTVAEVTKEARKLAETLREEASQYRTENDRISRAQTEEFYKATTNEERQAIWVKYTSQSGEISSRQRARYEQQHKSEAVLIRGEMISRLPKEEQEKIRVYHSAYMLGWFYEEIIDDLEMLVSMLAGSSSLPPQK